MKYMLSASLVTLFAGAGYAATIVVTPSNMGNWAFLATDENGAPPGYAGTITQMVNGPSTPPLGSGSAELATASGHGDASAQIRNTQYAGVRIDSLTSLSYSTYVTSNNGQQFPYIELNIATTGSGAPDDILFFEPPYQTPTSGNPSLPNQGDPLMNTWQTWNALVGGWWDNNAIINPGTGVGSLATYLATYPDATIENTTAGYGGVRITMGFASPDDNFDGNVDNFTIGSGEASSTYDFEAVPEPATAAFLALGGLLLLSRRRSTAH